MLKTWLNHTQRPNSQYKFRVHDFSETLPPNDNIINYLGNELLIAHGNPTRICAEYKMLADDAKELNLTILKNYVDNTILPSSAIVKIGNFGEIFCSKLLVEIEAFWFPIYKLRYREKRNWTMRLTDLCLIKTDGLSRPLICYGEVKTHSSRSNLNLGVEGHDSFKKDDALSNPEILSFMTTVLYESADPEKREAAKLLSSIRLGKLTYEKRYDLFLVHDKDTWNDEILARLDEIDLDKQLIDFSVKVIHISRLRELIDTTYDRASIAAGTFIND